MTHFEVPTLAKQEKALLGTVAVMAAGVGVLGLASSFEAVSAAGARWGFATPWMLPVGIDVAIPVFTAGQPAADPRRTCRLAWVRFVPWVLTLVTCWLNIAAGHSLSAKVAHGTMPLLWVVFSEIAAHVYAVRIGAATGRRMEKIRRSRWLLAFPSTFGLWRRMTLWEITSYTDALARERERQLARADLRDRHGRRWRSQTSRRTRVLLKLGELAPAGPSVEALTVERVSLETPQAAPNNPRPHPSRSRPSPSRARSMWRRRARLPHTPRAVAIPKSRERRAPGSQNGCARGMRSPGASSPRSRAAGRPGAARVSARPGACSPPTRRNSLPAELRRVHLVPVAGE